MAQITPPVQLRQQTLNSFSSYVRDAEAVMEQSLGDDRQFLWSDINPESAQRVRGGEVLAQFWSGHGPVKVPDGLIHDWIGASCIPGATVEDVLAQVQDWGPSVVAAFLAERREFRLILFCHCFK